MKRVIFFVSLLVAGFLTACDEGGGIPIVGELRAIVMGSSTPLATFTPATVVTSTPVATLSPAAVATSTSEPLITRPTVIPIPAGASQPAFSLLYFYADW